MSTRTITLAAAAFGAITGIGMAHAAPTSLGGLVAPSSGVEIVRARGRHHVRSSRVGRSAAPSQAGNARDPNRPVSQQNQGQTTGGPRY